MFLMQYNIRFNLRYLKRNFGYDIMHLGYLRISTVAIVSLNIISGSISMTDAMTVVNIFIKKIKYFVFQAVMNGQQPQLICIVLL